MCAAAIGATVACGQSEAQKQAQDASKQATAAGQQAAAAGQQAAAAGQQAASAAQSATNGLAQMAQGLTQMAQGLQGKNGQVAPPVDYEQLKALVPDLDGWKKENVKGEQMTSPFQYSKATAHYSKDNGSIDLDITDSALNQILIAPFSMFLTSGYSERSDEGYKKSAPVKGNPGYEEWQKDSKHAEITTVVNNRFIVQGTGHDVDNADVVRKLVESVDLAKLGTLK
jgi:hypothetical protein